MVKVPRLHRQFTSLTNRCHCQPSQAASWSHDDILSKIKAGTWLDDATNPDGISTVVRLDDATAAKLVWLQPAHGTAPEEHREALAMAFVRNHTTIPVPTLHHVVRHPEHAEDAYLVMDYIPGTRLDTAWPALSLWSRARVAWTLRRYVRQLRRIGGLRPGPLGPRAAKCPGNALSPFRDEGPFASAAELTAFMNGRSHLRYNTPIPPQYQREERLVFTHNDINMRNVVLGDDGRVWLIDWDWAGFYPVYFEFFAMMIAAHDIPTETVPRSWRYFIPFIVDPFFDRMRWLVGFPP